MLNLFMFSKRAKRRARWTTFRPAIFRGQRLFRQIGNLLLNFIPRNRDKVAGRHVPPLSSGVNSISNLCRFIPPILSGARYFLGIMQASVHLAVAQHSTSFLGVRVIVALEGAPWGVGEVQPVILGYRLASNSGMEE